MALVNTFTEDSKVERIAQYPYQKVLLRKQADKIDQLSTRLQKKLDDVFHVWIHDGTPLEPDAPAREPFLLKLKPTTPIGDIRDEIEERYNELGFHDRDIDGPLRLVYSGMTLVDGKRLCDYKIDTKRKKWSKPYAGIIWIVPFHVESKESHIWGSGAGLEEQENNLD